MTRDEAIEMLKVLNMMLRSPNGKPISDACDALDMAIEALHREEAEEKGWCHRIRPKNVEVVVRCKDCRHKYEEGKSTRYYWCNLNDRPVDDTDYCAWAERKDNGNA